MMITRVHLSDTSSYCTKCDGKCFSIRHCNGRIYDKAAFEEGLSHPVFKLLKTEIRTYIDIIRKLNNEFTNNYGSLSQLPEIQNDRRAAHMGSCTYHTTAKCTYFMYMITENLENILKQLNVLFPTEYHIEYYPEDVELITKSYKELSTLRLKMMSKLGPGYIPNEYVANTSRKLLRILNNIYTVYA